MKKMDKVMVAGLLCSLLLCGNSYAQKPVYVLDDAERVGSRVTYNYLADSMFHVNTKLGFVTDIELKPGETITYIAGGDTTRWLIDKATVANVQHVYIKPIEKGIRTNVIINTNLHSYRIEVSSGDEYDPLVTFRFPERDGRSGGRYESSYSVLRSNREVSSGVRRNFDYRIKAKKNADVSLMPVEIFDDGEKTYIRMPDDNKYDLPVIYNIDPWDGKTLSMVNYRRQDGYFVVDRVMEHGRLFYHQKFYIDFYNEAVQKTTVKEYRQKDTMAGRVRGTMASVPVRDGSFRPGEGLRVYGDGQSYRIGIRDREQYDEDVRRQEMERRKAEAQERKLYEEKMRQQELVRVQELERRAEQQRLREEETKRAEAELRKAQARQEKERKLALARQEEAARQAEERRLLVAEQRRIEAEKEKARQEAARKAEEKKQLEERRRQEALMKERMEAERLRQEELRRQEAKRIAEEQKARAAAEKERARQEAARKAELERQKAEEARRAEAIRVETAKRNAEIARLTELENKKMEEIKKLQEAKRQQMVQGQANINRIKNGGNRAVVSGK